MQNQAQSFFASVPSGIWFKPARNSAVFLSIVCLLSVHMNCLTDIHN